MSGSLKSFFLGNYFKLVDCLERKANGSQNKSMGSISHVDEVVPVFGHCLMDLPWHPFQDEAPEFSLANGPIPTTFCWVRERPIST